MIERRATEGRDAASVALVLGLGNPLRGDDGIGPRVIEELRKIELPEGAEAVDAGTGGIDLLHIMEGWDRVIVVDAADIHRPPGHFRRFSPEEVQLLKADGRFSYHRAGLADALALARALGRPLPDIVVFGVQPGVIGWGQGLSPAVEARLPALVDAVTGELSRGDKNECQTTGTLTSL
ncbi:MAG: hydrogenase maturation protease [Chloroflexota bacterium]